MLSHYFELDVFFVCVERSEEERNQKSGFKSLCGFTNKTTLFFSVK